MGDKILAKFVDDSVNESEFVVKINDDAQEQIESSTIFSTGTTYSKEYNNVVAGEKDVKVASRNVVGESEYVDLGTVDVYKRTDFVLYIGNEDVIGDNHLDELVLLEGLEASSLDKQISESLLLENIKVSSIQRSAWEKANPAERDNHGAEVSLIDGLKHNYHRQIAVWKLGIPNALATTSFSSNNEGLNYIQNNLNNHFLELYDLYNQAKVRAVIINMSLDHDNLSTSYQALIDWFRDFFNHPELPIILTNTINPNQGVEKKPQDEIFFSIEKDGLIGDYYEMRGMLGYYGQPDHHKTSNSNQRYNGYRFPRFTDLNLQAIDPQHTLGSGAGYIIQQSSDLRLSEVYSNYEASRLGICKWGNFVAELGTDADGMPIASKSIAESASILGVPFLALLNALNDAGGGYGYFTGNQDYGDYDLGGYWFGPFMPNNYPLFTSLWDSYFWQFEKDIRCYDVMDDGTRIQTGGAD